MKAAAPRPSRRRDSVRLRSLAVLLVPSVLLVAVFAIRQFRDHAPTVRTPVSFLRNNWQSAFDFGVPVEARRPVFPYSVIPGGVADGKELAAAASKDPVVARHYSGFRLGEAHNIRLERSTAMYVSYRVNERIYWTRNPMLIPAGETLISDGQYLARVRCGNRLSMIAAEPVSIAEPPRESLETPAFIPPLLEDGAWGEGTELFPAALAALPVLPLLPPVPGTAAVSSPGVFFPPILLPGVPVPGHSSSPPPGPPLPPPGLPLPPPAVATPEPAGLELLVAGTLLLAAGALLRR